MTKGIKLWTNGEPSHLEIMSHTNEGVKYIKRNIKVMSKESKIIKNQLKVEDRSKKIKVTVNQVIGFLSHQS